MILLALACSDPYDAKDHRPTVPGDGDTGVVDTDPPRETGDTAEQPLPDADGDGWADDADCVPDDASIHPGAEEVWYDGIDQDCAGDSDYDQDHDTFLTAEIGADDCDDTRADVYPGATETWYDGVDADCAGDDDFDQDQDGDATPDGGGDDCDDLDDDVSSAAEETLGDAVDADCDGDVDSFRFTALDLSSALGVQGPKIAADSAYVMVTFLADTYEDGGTAYDVAGLMHYLSLDEPGTGSVGMATWYWGNDYALHTGFDFYADDDYQAWAYGIQYDTTRYLLVDVLQVSSGIFRGTGWSYPTTKQFDDVELSSTGDGTLHVVGCDDQLGFLTWMHATPQGFLSNTDIAGDDVADADSTACVAHLTESVILVSQPSSARLLSYLYFDAYGLSYDGADPGWNAYDLDTDIVTGHTAFAAAEDTDGVYVEVDGARQRLASGAARDVEIHVGATGTAYVVYADGSGEPWLGWGSVGSMVELQLQTGLSAVDDVDVYVTSSRKLVVAARDGNRAAVGVVGF